MAVRKAMVAGRFYEGNPAKCLEHIRGLLPSGTVELPCDSEVLSAVVPHAGWVFSGDLAAMAFAAIQQSCGQVDTFVIFGAVHSAGLRCGAVYESGQWETPLGAIDVDEALAKAILDEADTLAAANADAHSNEHSIEVQVPFVQHLFEGAKIVPLMVPPTAEAHKLGKIVGRVVADSEKKVVCIASTDLTHYGPSYYFTPRGTGPEAIRWAKEENDRYFIDLVLKMRAAELVNASQTYSSACGAGAVAAVVSAAAELGVTRGHLLAHTTSAEVMAKMYGQQADDSVGYGAIVFQKENARKI